MGRRNLRITFSLARQIGRWRSRAGRTKDARPSLPRGLAARFDRDEKALRRILAKLGEPVGKLDKTLSGSLSTAERKMMYQFLKLRRKVGAAEGVRSGILEKHERMILEELYPQRAPQERALCFLPFLAAGGKELIDALAVHGASAPPQHCVVEL